LRYKSSKEVAVHKKLARMLVVGVAFGIWSCGSEDPTVTGSDGLAGSDGFASGIGGSVSGVGGSVSGAGGSSTGGVLGSGGFGTGGVLGSGGSSTGGVLGSGGSSTGGVLGSGGSSTGGVLSSGGSSTGGVLSSGGSSTGGVLSSGGSSTGGVLSSGGSSTGGVLGSGGSSTGGVVVGSGGSGTGGDGTGGDGTGGDGTGGGATVDCDAPMPTGGTDHCGANTSGDAGGLNWSLWSNALNSGSCITTYDTTAFSARWSESGDFLARIGLEWGGWGSTPQPYTAYGTILAQFSYNKTGTGGGFSYIGIYGWSNDPCVEYYIVEDSFNNFPFNPWNATQTGTATIDGEEYRLFRNTTNGTGGSRCSGVSTWDQFWSIRQSARQCGTVSITEHFDAWAAAGMTLGNMLEAKILVEVGGGTGSIEFPVANVTAE
jgi:endo-1,4-beta-xylanase